MQIPCHNTWRVSAERPCRGPRTREYLHNAAIPAGKNRQGTGRDRSVKGPQNADFEGCLHQGHCSRTANKIYIIRRRSDPAGKSTVPGEPKRRAHHSLWH